MEHTIYNKDLKTKLIIDETFCENTCIIIKDPENGGPLYHYLTPKDLKDFIGGLLHVQAKKRKQHDNFDRLSNTF